MNFFKTKPTTHIEEVRQQQATQMDEVCFLLHWSREQYCSYQFDQYDCFVNLVTNKCPQLRDKILYSPVFRGFWNNEWAGRDGIEFLPFARECTMGMKYMLEEYLFINNAMRLLEDEAFYMRFENIISKL